MSPAGRIVLADGSEYDTPSDAAKAVNGWIVWQTDANRTLASLRNVLRDVAASGTESNAAAEFLRDAGEQVRAGDTVSITVRELLHHWNARTRGTRITRRVEKDMASQGLATFPHFRDVTLDTPVRFFLLEEVSPEGTVEQAITQMQIDDFSQLAVMTGNKRKLIGAITWKSIAIARHNNIDATLQDCLIDAPEISYDQELVDVLGVLPTWHTRTATWRRHSS